MQKAGTPGECHLQTLQNNRLEVEDLGVEINRAESARGDDDALELGKHWFHCQASIQATQLQAKWSSRVESGFKCNGRLQGLCSTQSRMVHQGGIWLSVQWEIARLVSHASAWWLTGVRFGHTS